MIATLQINLFKSFQMMTLRRLILTMAVLGFLIVGVTSVSAESLIPEWVQNTALWYGQGTISEQEFIASIQYLINNKIIFLDEQEKETVLDPTILSDDVIVTKPRINQCSVLYQSYKNVGQSQFLSKYEHVNFINTCVKLYKDPVWQHVGDDRIEKINERFIELDRKIKEEQPKLSDAPSVKIISKIDIGQGKFNVKFNVCAGDEKIDKAKVLIKSEIEAIQVGTSKDIPENACRNYVSQIHAQNSANIQITILEQVYEE